MKQIDHVAATLSKIFEKTGNTELGQKLVSSQLSLDFCTGVTIAHFQELGNLHVKILWFIMVATTLPFSAGQALRNLSGSSSQPTAFLELRLL